MPILTLQPDESNGIDTSIISWVPNTPRGTDASFYTGNDGGNIGRGLIKFDLSSILHGAIVKSAVLTLTSVYVWAGYSGVLKIYRLKRPWVEAEATWNVYASGLNWQTAGGFGVNDCDQTEIGSATYNSALPVGTLCNVTLSPLLIMDVINEKFVNGFLLKGSTEVPGTLATWGSSNSGSNAPKLVIDYAPGDSAAMSDSEESIM
ncbi:MAG TPA: hypothetical protein DIW44_12560 [Anaerolineaceae bacterium]|nr:hypothetical protein [Anaerolineaceae bacterium]